MTANSLMINKKNIHPENMLFCEINVWPLAFYCYFTLFLSPFLLKLNFFCVTRDHIFKSEQYPMVSRLQLTRLFVIFSSHLYIQINIIGNRLWFI